MLNEHVNVAIPGGGFQAVEDVAEILAEVILNERAGFEFQRAEVTDGLQFCREMQFHEIPGNIGLRQELPECRIVRSGCAVFLLHQPWL
ncbi:Uncharacterised protein [Klebsiella pneumoniae]|mgnify:FL=1|nr:Uncharacterised protein [Klebsiella pneumoniae]